MTSRGPNNRSLLEFDGAQELLMLLRGGEGPSIRCRLGEDEEDSVYSNYEEKKLYIHEEGVGNKGGGTGNRNTWIDRGWTFAMSFENMRRLHPHV